MGDESSRTKGWTFIRTVVTIVVLVGCTTAAGFFIGLVFWDDASAGTNLGITWGVILSLILILPAAVLSNKSSRRTHDKGWQGDESRSEIHYPHPPGDSGGKG